MAYIGPGVLQRQPGVVLEQGNLLVRVIYKTGPLLKGQGQKGKVRVLEGIDIMNHFIQTALQGCLGVLLQAEKEMV